MVELTRSAHDLRGALAGTSRPASSTLVARRLHHGLGEPFDFLTWFEYAPAYAEAFEELVGKLRETEEWTYVEREVDIPAHSRRPPLARNWPALESIAIL